jgi:hypothetical protein
MINDQEQQVADLKMTLMTRSLPTVGGVSASFLLVAYQ